MRIKTSFSQSGKYGKCVTKPLLVCLHIPKNIKLQMSH